MAAVTYGTVRSLILNPRSQFSCTERWRGIVGRLTRLHRWFYVGTVPEPDRKPDLHRFSKPPTNDVHSGEVIPGSAITAKSGLPDGDHLSTAKNCSPVLDNNFGPNEFARAEKKFGYRGRPICGVANVLKLTGVTFSKNLRWWRTPMRYRLTSPPRLYPVTENFVTICPCCLSFSTASRT